MGLRAQQGSWGAAAEQGLAEWFLLLLMAQGMCSSLLLQELLGPGSVLCRTRQSPWSHTLKGWHHDPTENWNIPHWDIPGEGILDEIWIYRKSLCWADLPPPVLIYFLLQFVDFLIEMSGSRLQNSSCLCCNPGSRTLLVATNVPASSPDWKSWFCCPTAQRSGFKMWSSPKIVFIQFQKFPSAGKC